jgi:fructokinase
MIRYMDSKIYLGIDLGGTKIEIAALDESGTQLYQARISTPQPPPASNAISLSEHNNFQYINILQSIKQLVDNCEAELHLANLPLGIGIPGALSQETGLIKNANTVCLIGKDPAGDLSVLLKRTIKIENDANCFTLSEAIDGAGKNHESVFGVILGTGVGGGWVINNRLHIGANAISGEWGHNPLPWPSALDEPKQRCYCGKQGCIETYLSGRGFSRQTQLQFNLDLTCPEIIKKIPENEFAAKSYQLYVDRLARSLATVINIIDPEIIVLGGGVSNISSLYTDVTSQWHKYIFSDSVNTKLLKNTFGDSSGVRGAAWLNK